jgi:hypothetical protein
LQNRAKRVERTDIVAHLSLIRRKRLCLVLGSTQLLLSSTTDEAKQSFIVLYLIDEPIDRYSIKYVAGADLPEALLTIPWRSPLNIYRDYLDSRKSGI